MKNFSSFDLTEKERSELLTDHEAWFRNLDRFKRNALEDAWRNHLRSVEEIELYIHEKTERAKNLLDHNSVVIESTRGVEAILAEPKKRP